jgi:hypothetical protein
MEKLNINKETAIKIVGCLAGGFKGFLLNSKNVHPKEIPLLSALGVEVATDTVISTNVIINGIISYNLVEKRLCIGGDKYFFTKDALLDKDDKEVGKVITGFNNELIGFSFTSIQYTFSGDKINIQSANGLNLADYVVEFENGRLVCFNCGDDSFVLDSRKQLDIVTSDYHIIIDSKKVIDVEDFFNH